MKKLVLLGLFIIVLNEIHCATITLPKKELVIKLKADDLLKSIKSIDNPTPKTIYDFLSNKSKNQRNQDFIQMNYVLKSFLKSLPNTIGTEETLNKITNLIDSLVALQGGFNDLPISEQITYIKRLLKKDIFIHLSYDLMDKVINISDKLSTNMYQTYINGIEPEYNSNFFNAHFLTEEIKEAKDVFNQVNNLKNHIKNFVQDINKLSNDKLSERVQQANHYLNGLKFIKIKTNNKELPISQNIKKYLQNILICNINKLITKINK